MLEPLAHADHLVLEIAERGVEGRHRRVATPDLEVDLWTADRAQEPLGLHHHRAAMPGPPLLRRYREVVDPAAMTFVACHHRRHDRPVQRTDEEQLRVPRELPGDVLARVVPGAYEAAA